MKLFVAFLLCFVMNSGTVDSNKPRSYFIYSSLMIVNDFQLKIKGRIQDQINKYSKRPLRKPFSKENSSGEEKCGFLECFYTTSSYLLQRNDYPFCVCVCNLDQNYWEVRSLRLTINCTYLRVLIE